MAACGSKRSPDTAPKWQGVIVLGGSVNGAYGHYTILPDGSGLTRAGLKGGENVSLSPDRRFVTYTDLTYRRPEYYNVVFVAFADGSRRLTVPLPISKGGGDTYFPSLSPGGKRLAVAISRSRTGPRDLWTAAVTGHGLKRLASTGGVERSTWSPDGGSIAFVDLPKREGDDYPADLYVVRANGTGLQRIARGVAPDSLPAWSPDGARIAFVDQGGDIDVVASTGGRRERAISNGNEPAWSPDGRYIAFLRPEACSRKKRESGYCGATIFVGDPKDGRTYKVGPTVVRDEFFLPLSWWPEPPSKVRNGQGN